MSERVEFGCPVGEVGSGHVVRNVSMRLTPAQGRALKALVSGLRAGNCELANGRRVNEGPDALRWLLEQYGGVVGS